MTMHKSTCVILMFLTTHVSFSSENKSNKLLPPQSSKDLIDRHFATPLEHGCLTHTCVTTCCCCLQNRPMEITEKILAWDTEYHNTGKAHIQRWKQRSERCDQCCNQCLNQSFEKCFLPVAQHYEQRCINCENQCANCSDKCIGAPCTYGAYCAIITEAKISTKLQQALHCCICRKKTPIEMS